MFSDKNDSQEKVEVTKHINKFTTEKTHLSIRLSELQFMNYESKNYLAAKQYVKSDQRFIQISLE